MSEIPQISDDTPFTVATIEKNSREQIRFDLSTYRGHRLISARVWVQKADGTRIPTKSGLNVRIDLLGDILKALDLVERAARDAGWLDSPGKDHHA